MIERVILAVRGPKKDGRYERDTGKPVWKKVNRGLCLGTCNDSNPRDLNSHGLCKGCYKKGVIVKENEDGDGI